MDLGAVQILDLFEYKTTTGRNSACGIWILGSADQPRVTVLSQQNRAITLVSALFETGRAGSDSKIGIIGGGAAGLTAACFAIESGAASVNLFESDDSLLPMFSAAEHRWLHPGLFNWPNPGWAETHTRLPCLNWEFATAPDVRQQILNGFKDYLSAAENLRTHKSKEIQGLMRQDPPTIKDASGQTFVFDHLILALGFGTEQTTEGGWGYWGPEPDELHDQEHLVVIGTGDGGLFDAVRARVSKFNEHAFVDKFYPQWPEDERRYVETEIAQFEQEHRQSLSAAAIGDFYRELKTPFADKWFRDQLAPKPRVTLIGPEETPLTYKAAPINRFLLSVLQRVDRHSCFEYRQGRWESSDTAEGGTVVLATESAESLDSAQKILRIGSAPALQQFDPDIYDFAVKKLNPRSEMDFHREFKVWTTGVPGSALPDAAARSRGVFGRQADVSALADKLHIEPVVVVFGLSGVGKTKLIEELRYTQEHQGRAIKRCSVSAETSPRDFYRQIAALFDDRREIPTLPPKIDSARNYDGLLEPGVQRRSKLLHIEQAQSLLLDGEFREPGIEELLGFIANNMSEVRVVLESREDLHEREGLWLEGFQVNGIDVNALTEWFRQPFGQGVDGGWDLEESDAAQIYQRLGGSEHVGGAHPLAAQLLAAVAAGKQGQDRRNPLDVLKQYPEKLLENLEKSLFGELFESILTIAQREFLSILSVYRNGTPDLHIDSIAEAVTDTTAFGRLVDRCIVTSSPNEEWHYVHALIRELALARVAQDKGRGINHHEIAASAWLAHKALGQRPSLPNIRAHSEAAFHCGQAQRFDLLQEIAAQLIDDVTITYLQEMSDQLFSAKRLEDNRSVLELLIAIDDRDHRSHRFLGETLEKLDEKNAEIAFGHYLVAHELYPKFSPYLADLGRFLRNHSRPEEFVDFVERLSPEVRNVTLVENALSIYADCLSQTGNQSLASALRNEQIATGSKSAAFYVDEALYLGNALKDPTGALAVLERAVALEIEGDFLVSVRAKMLERVGRGEEASQIRSEQIDAGSMNPVFYRDEALYLGNALKDPTGALAVLERAVALEIENDRLVAVRAAMLERVGRGEEASRIRTERIDARSIRRDLYADQALYLGNTLKDPAKALAVLERAVALEIENDYLVGVRAKMLERVGRGEEASVIRTEQIDAGSNNPFIYVDEALYLSKARKNPAEALAVLERAVALEIENDYLVGVRAKMLERVGRGEEASVIRTERIDAGSNNPFIYVDEALYLSKARKNPAEALALLDRAIALRIEGEYIASARSGMYLMIAEDLEELQQYDRAFDALLKGLAETSDIRIFRQLKADTIPANSKLPKIRTALLAQRENERLLGIYICLLDQPADPHLGGLHNDWPITELLCGEIFLRTLRFCSKDFDLSLLVQFWSKDVELNFPTLIALAEHLEFHNHAEAALALLARAGSRNLDTERISGNCYRRLGRFKDAEKYFVRALDLATTAKERAILHNNIAMAIKSARDFSTFDDGIEHAISAIQENLPNFPYPKRLLTFFKLSLSSVSNLSEVVDELKRDWNIGKKTIDKVIREIRDDALADEWKRIR